MKLVELEPRWFSVNGNDDKDGVTFLCPCCLAQPEKQTRLAVQFANPIGCEPKSLMTNKQKTEHVHELRTFDVPPGFLWQRIGETFETLTLTPSVDCSASGHWHGFINAGVVT